MVTRLMDEPTDYVIPFPNKLGLQVQSGKSGDNFTVIGKDGFEFEIPFQVGDPKFVGLNGLTNEALLTIVQYRIGILNKTLPSPMNQLALESITTALAALDARSYRREVEVS